MKLDYETLYCLFSLRSNVIIAVYNTFNEATKHKEACDYPDTIIVKEIQMSEVIRLLEKTFK